MKKKKVSFKRILVFIVFIASMILLGLSIYNIFKWIKDGDSVNNQVQKINDLVNITPITSENNIEIIETHEEKPLSHYWKYLNMNLIDVDLRNLININNDTKGWISVNGTNINYPFVQTSNNNYYLNHSFDKKYNEAGWVFMDYRNDAMNLGKNTILYAHGRLDTIMFGSLKNIIESDWYKNSDNYVIKLSTINENTLWQVFSVYHIKTTSDYIQTDFSDDLNYKAFLDLIKGRSIYNFDTALNTSDKILTLSTCYNEKEKVVMHAKLIKRQIKESN